MNNPNQSSPSVAGRDLIIYSQYRITYLTPLGNCFNEVVSATDRESAIRMFKADFSPFDRKKIVLLEVAYAD